MNNQTEYELWQKIEDYVDAKLDEELWGEDGYAALASLEIERAHSKLKACISDIFARRDKTTQAHGLKEAS